MARHGRAGDGGCPPSGPGSARHRAAGPARAAVLLLGGEPAQHQRGDDEALPGLDRGGERRPFDREGRLYLPRAPGLVPPVGGAHDGAAGQRLGLFAEAEEARVEGLHVGVARPEQERVALREALGPEPRRQRALDRPLEPPGHGVAALDGEVQEPEIRGHAQPVRAVVLEAERPRAVGRGSDHPRVELRLRGEARAGGPGLRREDEGAARAAATAATAGGSGATTRRRRDGGRRRRDGRRRRIRRCAAGWRGGRRGRRRATTGGGDRHGDGRRRRRGDDRLRGAGGEQRRCRRRRRGVPREGGCFVSDKGTPNVDPASSGASTSGIDRLLSPVIAPPGNRW